MPTLGPSSSKEQASSRFGGTKYKDQSSATDKIEGKPLPALDAEQGLLAACILDTTGEIMGRCAEQALTTDHFYHFNHQVIYESLLELNRENKATDEILLAEKLESKSQLEQIGGQSALFDLTSRIDTTHMQLIG